MLNQRPWRSKKKPTSTEIHHDAEGNLVTVHFDSSGYQIPPWECNAVLPGTRFDAADIAQALRGCPCRRARRRQSDYSVG